MSSKPTIASSGSAGAGASRPLATLAQKTPSVPHPVLPRATGGNIGSLVAGMAVCGVTLYAFWRLQFFKQGRVGPNAENASSTPTWQHRYAQQVTVASPGTNVNTAATETVTHASTFQSKQKPTFLAPNIPVPGDAKGFEPGVKGAVLSHVHDAQNVWKDGEHVEQPAKARRFGEYGQTYTKNTDYVDNYARGSYKSPNSDA